MIIINDDLDIHLMYIIINNYYCDCRILACSGKDIQKNLGEPPSCGDYKNAAVYEAAIQIIGSGTLSGFVKCKIMSL